MGSSIKNKKKKDDKMVTNDTVEDLTNLSSSKRVAQGGQWTTPPHPVFLSSDVNTYETLQTAYRRGAEYAATVSHQQQVTSEQHAAQQQAFFAGFVAAQQQPLVNNTACVNKGVVGGATAALKEQQAHESCPDFQNFSGPSGLPQMYQPTFFKQPTTTTLAASASAGPPPAPVQFLPAETFSSNRNSNLQQAHESCPNFDRGTQEDDKRRKRLSRNRTSARLRRLKKKNLVETYESEVSVLESSLKKLQCHDWGSSEENHDCLLEALSMDRGGQQSLSIEERNKLITDILKQQCDQVDNLLDAQTEIMVLHWLTQMQQQNNEYSTDVTQEEKEIQTELEEILQLSDTQRAQLSHASEGAHNDYSSITTIQTCLRSLLENEYLVKSELEDVYIEPFMSIFHPSQISKFLLWCDHNSDAIDQLDFVNAPQEIDSLDVGPKFVFGIEEAGVNGNIDDEEKH